MHHSVPDRIVSMTPRAEAPELSGFARFFFEAV